VLVHGCGGTTSDEGLISGGYFPYCFDQEMIEEVELYEADVSPSGSIHDRACELYQQLVGIRRVEIHARKNQVLLSEQVYGSEHVREKHQDTFYKIKYLKRKEKGRIWAYPHGVPGGWSSERKLHLVGHSQGAVTIRYLQYLLFHGYFRDEFQGKDRSDWIASVTCVNGILNGGLGGHYFAPSQEEQRYTRDGTWK